MSENNEKEYTISFPATVEKVQTTHDGGIRVYIDLPENYIDVMAMLAECKRRGISLNFVATPHEYNSVKGHSAIDRRKRSLQRGK